MNAAKAESEGKVNRIRINLTDESAQELVVAIVKQAADDYRDAAAIFRKKPSVEALELMREVEDFFMSDYFQTITFVDGKPILERLRDEVGSREWMRVKDAEAFCERVKASQEGRGS